MADFKILFYHANNETRQHKLKKTGRTYAKERLKQREHLNEEMAHLEKLLKSNLMDEETHKRLKKRLLLGYDQKRRETRVRYGF